jgi:hypothetical protein
VALTPAAVQRLSVMQELPVHVASAILASKLRAVSCPLHRGPRYVGKSKMNLVGLIQHGLRALMVFPEDVLVRVGISCAIISTTSIVFSFTAIGLKIIDVATPGWFSLALGLLFLIVLQAISLAITTLMTLIVIVLIRSAFAQKPQHYSEFVESVFMTRATSASRRETFGSVLKPGDMLNIRNDLARFGSRYDRV